MEVIEVSLKAQRKKVLSRNGKNYRDKEEERWGERHQELLKTL